MDCLVLGQRVWYFCSLGICFGSMLRVHYQIRLLCLRCLTVYDWVQPNEIGNLQLYTLNIDAPVREVFGNRKVVILF